MADNVTSSLGTADGAVFATDDIAGVHYPIVKLTYGALDSQTIVSASNGLPVAQQGTWNVTNVSGTVSLPTGASTAAKQPALGTAGTASADVITIQGIASMTKLLVTPDANSAVNVAQLAGTTTDTNSGTKSAGTLRVVLATDQPQLTNKLLVTPDANSAVNVAQINGVATTMGNGVSGTGVQRVTIASDSTGQVALASGAQVQPVPGTAGGLSFTYLTSAATNNKTQVKGSAGQIYFISVQSIHSAPIYLKVFNNTSAGVTAGTTAADFQFMCPANSTAANGAGVVFNFDPGIAMSTGITIMLTTGISTTDNTATAANIAVVTVGYK